GTPVSQFGSTTVSQYAKAGIPIIVGTNGGQLPADVIGDPGGAAMFSVEAKALPAWFVADSNGQGKAIFAHVTGLALVLNEITADFQADVAQMCSQCTVKVVDTTIGQAESGAESGAIVAVL